MLSHGLPPPRLSCKESVCDAGSTGDAGLTPGSGRPPGGGNGSQPAPVFLLANPMDRGAWRTTVSRVAKSWTWLERLRTYAHVGLWGNIRNRCTKSVIISIKENVVEDGVHYISVLFMWEFIGGIFLGSHFHEKLLSSTAGHRTRRMLWLVRHLA